MMKPRLMRGLLVIIALMGYVGCWGGEPEGIAIRGSLASVPVVDASWLVTRQMPRRLLRRNRALSVYAAAIWRRNMWPILAIIGVALAQSALIASLLIQHRRRRVSELALRRSEERYRDVVDSQTDVVCRFLPDTTLTFVNDAYCRFFGRSREELVGSKFLVLIPESARNGALSNISTLLERREVLTHEHQVLMSNGRIGWQRWTNHVIHRTDGRATEIQAVGQDITDRKRAEEAQLNLAHASRLALLGELTAMVAHEVKQPLAAILNNAETAKILVESTKPPLDEISTLLSDICKDDMRANDAIQRIRTLLHKQEMRIERMDLNETLSDVLPLVAGDARRRHVRVRSRFAADLPPALGDRVHIQHVLLNLMINAMDAMSETPEPGRELEVETKRSGIDQLEVTVTDFGPGISASELPSLFDSFFTTKRDGLGLGLSIARSIIEAHRGRIWAENKQTGATFHFTVPAETQS